MPNYSVRDILTKVNDGNIRIPAFQRGFVWDADVSRMAPLYRAEIILTVILAVIFLKEKDNLKIKILSAIIAALGVVLIR